MSSLKNKDKVQATKYWRSYEQLAETPEFKKFLEREFPEGASEFNDPIGRRKFLTLMGASMALAGLAGCRRPVEKIVPYVKAPEDVIPGVPKYYATTLTLGTSAYGVLVESHEGRPTKIEGNEKHPSTLGRANALLQAAILNLYDPDRSKFILNSGAQKTWDDFAAFWAEQHAKYSANRGEGLAVLAESFSSPTLFRLKKEFERAFPRAKWVTYESVSDENIHEGMRIATGRPMVPQYHFDKAKVVLSLDADFLQTESESILNNKGFADSRRITSEKDSMSRLYVVEPVFSITGSMADHRLSLQARQIGAFTAALALELKKQGLRLDTTGLGGYANHDFDKKWLTEVAKDLRAAGRNALVVAGRRQPAAVHALVFAINKALGAAGNTVSWYAPVDKTLPDRKATAALIDDMARGAISTLFILGGNPAYDAPSAARFAAAMRKVENTIHLSSHVDETSSRATWHLPRTHSLEQWGDARAADGTVSVVQPLILPLYGAYSDVEVVNFLTSNAHKTAHELVRQTLKKVVPATASDKAWRKVLHDGLAEKTALSARVPAVKSSAIARAVAANPFPKDKASAESPEIVFTASASVHDGRYANNGWLQELPDPVTKIAWDNAALMNRKTAEALGVASRQIITIARGDKTARFPVWVLPGVAENTIVLEVGYGRTHSGRVGDNVGFDVSPLRSADAWDFATGMKVIPSNESWVIANTQDHNVMEGRPIVREATLEEYRHEPNFAPEMVEYPTVKGPDGKPMLFSLWEDHTYESGYQWGMSIDLNVCTGCNACTIACQSENNVPIVGKEQVHNGREMHWLRMDRYFVSDDENEENLDDPRMVHQPMGCQHCEMAPCEQVCPVAATVHDKEGLNVMTYNRCIGTRYCANNCPYKVRRFNFFNFTKDTPEVVKMAMNPDVTVRFRGVMEKCTYCLQRINEAKIVAKREGRTLQDGDVVTACQQTCPTDAIVFGNINDPESRVSKLKKQNRDYALLAELNVRPRTTYLAKIRNPNPALVTAEKTEHV